MYLINTFLILAFVFTFINIFYNYFFLFKIKKIKKNNINSIYINKRIQYFLILLNVFLFLLCISALFLDIFAGYNLISFKNINITARFLIIINLLYFVLSNFSYLYLYRLYNNMIIIISNDKLITISFNLKLDEIINIQKVKNNNIKIIYNEYNEFFKIYTINNDYQNKLFLFLTEAKNNINDQEESNFIL